jgi:hypothetical protein
VRQFNPAMEADAKEGRLIAKPLIGLRAVVPIGV